MLNDFSAFKSHNLIIYFKSLIILYEISNSTNKGQAFISLLASIFLIWLLLTFRICSLGK
jgi:hypothetical protein